ncbi:MAG: cytochrome-c peroxidase [Bacteroidetes bacterium]|nr:MAG: cytochrome-c peroxidase [Bacteroidota bacterium]
MNWTRYLLAAAVVGGLLLYLPACEQPAQSSKKLSRRAKNKLLIDSLAHFGALPQEVKSPRDNPLTPEKIKLGKLLFFDPILSGNRDVACASCHHPAFGFAENLELSVGVNGKGLGSSRHFRQPNDIPIVKRNAPTVVNAAYNGIDWLKRYEPEEAPMFWDVRVKSLEKQALEPIKALEEMRGRRYSQAEIIPEVVSRLNSIPAYLQLFEAAFGSHPAIREEHLAKALAAYQRSLIAPNSRFDRYMRGDKSAISLSEKEGFKQFIESGCGNCHNGPMFSDYQLHVLGVPENPLLEQPDMGPDSSYAFRTPTLRNLRFTAPYMHNGSLNTLQRVLEFYEDIAGGKMRNPNLSRDQLDPLVDAIELDVSKMAPIISFLNTLNDESVDRSVPESVPSGLPVGGNIQ